MRMNLGKEVYGIHNNETLLKKNILLDVANNCITNITECLQTNITEEYMSVPYHPITTFIEQYTIPVICLLGLIGNTLASIVFLQKPLRNSSCSIFLASRGFSDNGFLSTLLIIWISQTFRLQLGSLSSSCKAIIFLTYICGFISVWLVVFVTLENYIRICKPFIVKQVCTTVIAECAVALLSFIAIGVYNFPFWAMTADTCEPFAQYHEAVQALIYTDTVITLVLPLLCIICLMTAIVCDLIKSYRKRKRTTLTVRAESPLAKVTKMLLAVTLTFFCLNLPSHVYRLIIMISSLVSSSAEENGYSILEEAIQQITLLMSYLSFSTNIIVYTIFGSKFRKVLLNVLHLQAIVSDRASKSNPHVRMSTAHENKQLNNSCNSASRSLIVLLKDNEYFAELEPLQRAYTQ